MRLIELRNLGCESSVEKFTVTNIFVARLTANAHRASGILFPKNADRAVAYIVCIFEKRSEFVFQEPAPKALTTSPGEQRRFVG
jgi:hypothetical protein